MAKFQNMKIRINSIEHSKQVQDCLFELGYKWSGHIKNEYVLYDSNLFVYADGFIFNGTGERYFNKHGNEEVTLEQLQTMLAEQSGSVEKEPSDKFTPEYTIATYMNQLQQLLKDSKLSVSIYHDEILIFNVDNDDQCTVKSWDEVIEVIKVKQQYLAKFSG